MNDLPSPESRNEEYLQNIATGTGEIPDEPESRVEEYLAYIAENGIPVPIATASSLGVIKVGSGLSITADGTLSLGLQSADTEEY